MKASEIIKTECCSVGLLSCHKPDLVVKVKELELQVVELTKEVDEYNRLRANKEDFAKQVFKAGRDSVLHGVTIDHSFEQSWLQYKVENL